MHISQMLAAANLRWQTRHDIGIRVRDVMGRASQIFSRPIVRWVEGIQGRSGPIPVGSIRFGHLKRLTPIDRRWGSNRGKPVDRVYIERFLAKNATHIRGQVLELQDNQYTHRFGGNRIERSHVLSLEANPEATIIADLEHKDALPKATFDCIILTEVLQELFDIHRAVENLYDGLKPGGVLLVTTPGISPMDESEWYWAFAAAALYRLLADRFGQDAVNVEAHGNVHVAAAFLYGLAVEDLDCSAFDIDDSRYPVTVAARAIKPRLS
jgi:SAM-dependent methyltransferase